MIELYIRTIKFYPCSYDRQYRRTSLAVIRRRKMNANGLHLLLKESDEYIQKLNKQSSEKDTTIKQFETSNDALGYELYKCYSSVDKMNATMHTL